MLTGAGVAGIRRVSGRLEQRLADIGLPQGELPGAARSWGVVTRCCGVGFGAAKLACL